MSHRDEQFASFVKKELAVFLDRTVSREKGVFFSVTQIAINQSGKRAEVFISIFPKQFAVETMKALKLHEGEARMYLADKLKRRQIPFIVFILDESQEAKIRLEKLLENPENK